MSFPRACRITSYNVCYTKLLREAVYLQADAADEAAMAAAVERATRLWGGLDGVLHAAGVSGAAHVRAVVERGFEEAHLRVEVRILAEPVV